MKRILLITFICCLSFTSNGQIITVNNAADPESSFTLEELVEDILISSECSTVDTFSSQVNGGARLITTKSYGYFKKPIGSSFPFDEGIILTTGQAFLAGNTSNPGRVDIVNNLPPSEVASISISTSYFYFLLYSQKLLKLVLS